MGRRQCPGLCLAELHPSLEAHVRRKLWGRGKEETGPGQTWGSDLLERDKPELTRYDHPGWETAVEMGQGLLTEEAQSGELGLLL